MNLLSEIIEHKRAEVAKLKVEITDEFLKSHSTIRKRPMGFLDSLRSSPMALIAEIKRRSPSAGDINAELKPDHVAEAYEKAGAQAISILIDKKYFGGEESDFILARESVDIPLLYKEFVVDTWQIWHAASLGSSGVLLIAAVLDQDMLADCIEVCEHAHLDALVEVHDEDEMNRARDAGASCIGINNRDLRTFKVDLETSLRLAEKAPDSAFLISESGIKTPDHVERLKNAGIGGVLVGEHILRQPDPVKAVRQLMEPAWASS